MNAFKTIIAATTIALTVPMAAPAIAQDFPLEAGEYAEVSGIFVNDCLLYTSPSPRDS